MFVDFEPGFCWLISHRYRTANLLLAGIMPGPKEADVDQVHFYMIILVNELLHLWADSVIIYTSKFPNGRLVRIALVAVVCDKPTAHKLGGFGSHAHQFFCTKCWITQEQKATPAAFAPKGEESLRSVPYDPAHGSHLLCRLQVPHRR
jgi:hypothetical protein